MYQPSGFIPTDLTINGWSDLEPYFTDLKQREPADGAELEQLIIQYSEVLSVFHEQNAWSYINMSRETANEDYQKRYELFATVITPEVNKAGNAIEKKIAEHSAFNTLDNDRYGQFRQKLERELSLFRDENVPIQAEIAKLSSKYDQLTGGLTVTLDGEELPLPKAGVRLQSPDRATRKEAWLAISEARHAIKDEVDEVYNEMLTRRHQMALNAGYKNYRDFQHDSLMRFDYTPADAEAFQDSVA